MIRQERQLTDLSLALPSGAGLGRQALRNLVRIVGAVRQARAEWRYEKAMRDAFNAHQRRDLGIDRGAS